MKHTTMQIWLSSPFFLKCEVVAGLTHLGFGHSAEFLPTAPNVIAVSANKKN